ncbi:ATP-grasp domain-containing protein [Actinokineospora spheciospongiae]|uniref:ATP-grasp domain-containing protein n=1 Tax=Actinokineospora spheciospongiae TaxID=909613 RepID=UPI000D7194A4|nr:ATP-grasp domain-containing protein [Actinokineospora spheciospongiae]PWW58254.1 ATP-grasp domain-containing protein [Actinokineospora spheciospongiae]
MNRAVVVVYRPEGGRYRSQLRAVVAQAKRLGREPIALLPEGWSTAETRGLITYHADLDDEADATAAFDLVCAEHDVERVFPLFEGDVLPASRWRKKHGIPGLLPDQALNFRDKNVMHLRAEELGVRVARSCQPHTLGTVLQFADEVGFPVVVKPAAGWACGGTHRVDSEADLRRVWGVVGDDRHHYRVEEFIHGAEYHVDVLVQDGQTRFEQLSKYTYSILDYRDEPGGTISRKYDLSPVERGILELNAVVLNGFELRTGVSHAEYFVRDDGEIVFGEAAARAGGGSIVPAIEAGCGINLAGEWCALELDPTHRPPTRLGPEIGTEYLSTDQVGPIVSMSTRADLLAIDSVLDAQLWKQVGDVLQPPTASNDVLGWYVCRGTGEEDIRGRFKTIRDRFVVRTGAVGQAEGRS